MLLVLGFGYLVFWIMRRSQETVPQVTDGDDAKRDHVVGTDEQGRADPRVRGAAGAGARRRRVRGLLKDEIRDQGREEPASAGRRGLTEPWAPPSGSSSSLVVGGRLVLPLFIPYFPVPALLACLILDSVDQSIFQQFPAIPLDGYQSYDKALDVYYLSVAYLSTLRNWTNQGAFRMSQFLYYYRMVGVVIFEMTQNRTILFIFPNTFEYFFLFVEAVRLGWDTKHMGRKTVILSAAAIWIFIKLPQEWWIHIAQLDMTDFIKETLFGVDATDSWSDGDRQPAVGADPGDRDRARHRRHRLLDHQEEGAAVRPQARGSSPTRCRRCCAARSRTARSAPRPASSAGRCARRSRSRPSSASSSASC